jgi:hypothetical protein
VGVGVAVRFETHIAVVAAAVVGFEVGVQLRRGDPVVGVHCCT